MRGWFCVLIAAVAGCGDVVHKAVDASPGDDARDSGGGMPPKAPTFIQPPARFFTSYGETGGLAVADFNADGKPDVAAFNKSGNTGIVTTLLSNGQGSFPTITDGGPTNAGSAGVAIAAGLMGNTVMGATLATGSAGIATFSATAAGVVDYMTNYNLTFPTATMGQAAAMAPLDGGAKSFIVEGTNQMLVVSAPAAGTNYTTPGTQYLMGVSVKGIAFGNLHGAASNAPDIAAVGTDTAGGHLYVLPNNGSAAFGVPQTIALPAAPTAVATGDVDGGDPDVVVATANQVLVFHNQSGTLATAPAHMYAAQATVTAVALADFNGDGKLDIAASSNGSDQVAVYTGNGDGSFNTPVVFAAGQTVRGIGVADFNGDGKLDIVVAGFVGVYLLQNTTM